MPHLYCVGRTIYPTSREVMDSSENAFVKSYSDFSQFFSMLNRVDYSEWPWYKKNGLTTNDEEEEVEEEKGMIRKLIDKFKNLLHKIGKRR